MTPRHRSSNTSPLEALRVFVKLAAERASTLNHYSVSLSQNQDNDENENSESPILDFFSEICEAQALHTLINTSFIEISEIFDTFREHATKKIQKRNKKTFAVLRKGRVFHVAHCFQALRSLGLS